jgi:hypothetical protein
MTDHVDQILDRAESAPVWVRRTGIEISYLDPPKFADGKEFRFHLKRYDGGPLDGTWDLYETEDEVLEYLRYFLFKREGEIVIHRGTHPEFDRRADELDKTRRRDDGEGVGWIETFAPDSSLHGL